MTKLIVTIGPSSLNVDTLKLLKEAGASSFRINLSHSDPDALRNYFSVFTKAGIKPAIDTQGAQLRVTSCGSSSYIEKGEECLLIFGGTAEVREHSTHTLYLNHAEAANQLGVGDVLKVDFGGLSLAVTTKVSEASWACRAISTGTVIQNRAVDVSNKRINLNILTDFDRYAIDYAVENGCDEIYASFVSTPEDIHVVRDYINNSSVQVISKIETSLGVANAQSICDLSDEILIDRGDLSREISIPSVPIAVKGITQIARNKNTPVNIATNVLDSMMSSSLPSRAEISDIFTLLEMGVNGIVLAAEVAIGKNPVSSTALINYLGHLYESHKDGLFGIAQPQIPDRRLIGDELYEWL